MDGAEAQAGPSLVPPDEPPPPSGETLDEVTGAPELAESSDPAAVIRAAAEGARAQVKAEKAARARERRLAAERAADERAAAKAAAANLPGAMDDD